MSIKPSLDVSPAVAQAIVDRAFNDQKVAKVSSLHGGEIAAVYEIAFDDPAPSVILKVYPHSLHWKMQKETHVIALIEERLSVPVPRVLLVDDTKQVLDLNLMLMSKLDGAVLGTFEPTLTVDQSADAYRQIGSLLREFHRIPMEAFGYIGAHGIVAPHPSNHAYVTSQFARKLSEFRKRGGPDDIADRVARHVTDRDDVLQDCQQVVLCHNDLHAGNLLAKRGDGRVRLCGVVDFENALAGDPLMDIAKAAYYLGEESKRALLEGYGDMKRRNGLQALRLYHLYFILELWCWMAEIGNTQPLDKLSKELEKFSEAQRGWMETIRGGIAAATAIVD